MVISIIIKRLSAWLWLAAGLSLLLSCASSPAKPAESAASPAVHATAASPQLAIKDQSPGAQLDYYIDLRNKAQQANQDRNRAGEALDLANSGLELFPDASELWWIKFNAYRSLGYPAKAQAISDRLLKDKDPSVFNHLHELGDLYQFDLADPNAGINWYSQQIDRYGDEVGWSWHQRGWAWLTVGNLAKAKADFERAAQIAKRQNDQGLLDSSRRNLQMVSDKEAGK